jgi:hypothetical protein
MGSALQPPFVGRLVEFASAARGVLRVLAGVNFVVAVVLFAAGFFLALHGRGPLTRVGGSLDMLLAVILVVNGIKMLRTARGQAVVA